MVTGGRAPVALHIDGNIYKIFFGSYDSTGRGRIFSGNIDLTNPTKLFDLQTDPLLNLGNVGFYDDNGIIPSCVLRLESKIFLYTIGFSLKNKIIFDAASGLAISDDKDLNFKKLNGPVLDRSVYDPCFAASPCVIHDNGKFKMWYVSCDRWEELSPGKYKHYYNIKYKESEDGIHWEPFSKIAIDYANEYEYAISRPFVVKDGPTDYKMWYSFRAQKDVSTYRIGYAESVDGINWIRKDELMKHFDISESGWDSEMICYPCIFDHLGKRYMLYNGNNYGKTGFGIAVLE